MSAELVERLRGYAIDDSIDLEKMPLCFVDATPASDDPEMNDALFDEMRHARIDQARAAIAAMSGATTLEEEG